jgi:dienelactone hydrolase
LGAGGVTDRVRNFSNWAYWRLHLERVIDSDPCPVDALASELDLWRDRVRTRLHQHLGEPPPRVPLAIETTESIPCGSYTRERVVFDTEATMSVPAYLLVPDERTQPGPGVLAIHGHGAGKSLVCGIDAGGPGDDYARALASLGYVVLAPDLRGFGERADWMPPDKYHCDWDLVCATMAGITPLARNLWDLQRALDVLSAHPLVDPARIAACGLSFGGTCTLFLAAIDPRVKAAIVSGYLSSWRAAHTIPWNMCGSQVMPSQLGAFEHLDIAALIAPRPLLVETGVDDLIFPVDAARGTVDALRQVYAAAGAPDGAVVHDVFDGEHRWHGALVPDFLEQWL